MNLEQASLVLAARRLGLLAAGQCPELRDLERRVPPHDLEDARELLTAHQEAANISCVTYLDPSYPRMLRHSPGLPHLLFYRGALPLLNSRLVAVVGSRNADRIGTDIASELAMALARQGLAVISGLALGVDGAAHRGAVDASIPGSTFAVLAHGLTTIYPRQHYRLAEEIVSGGGGLISEYEPGTSPLPHRFLERNRIIAGMCELTIIVQAGKRSGALATARCALDAGRDVLVVPGSVREPRYDGSNELLKVGAVPITSYRDVLEFMGIEHRDEKPKAVFPDPLLQFLREVESRAVNELYTLVESPAVLLTRLMELELEGEIVRLPGDRIAARRAS